MSKFNVCGIFFLIFSFLDSQFFFVIAIFACSIAFKPAESGWGFSNKYNDNFDKIFSGNKNNNDKSNDTEGKGDKKTNKEINDHDTSL